MGTIRATKRPLNKCGDCGHTWYPKGRSISLKCPACHGKNTKRAGIGLGAAILIIAGLALFGGGKKDNSHEAAAPDVSPASAVTESAPDISTAPNAQVLASEAAAAVGASAAQLPTAAIATSQSVGQTSQPSLLVQAAASEDASSDDTSESKDHSEIQPDLPESSDVASTQPAMLSREHH